MYRNLTCKIYLLYLLFRTFPKFQILFSKKERNNKINSQSRGIRAKKKIVRNKKTRRIRAFESGSWWTAIKRSKVSSTLTGQTVSVISRVRSLRKRNTGPDEKDVRKEAAATLPWAYFPFSENLTLVRFLFFPLLVLLRCFAMNRQLYKERELLIVDKYYC